jgi:hypothetical protein
MYERLGGGKYLSVDATGLLTTLPTGSEGVEVMCSDADIYFVTGPDTLALADCKVPVSSGDPCSNPVMNGKSRRIRPGRDTHVAIKAASGTAAVWLTSVEV